MIPHAYILRRYCVHIDHINIFTRYVCMYEKFVLFLSQKYFLIIGLIQKKNFFKFISFGLHSL